MYHRYVCSKQPYFIPLPVNENGESPPRTPDLPSDIRAQEVLDEVMLRRQHRLTPIPPSSQSKPTTQQKSDNSITIEDLGELSCY